MDVKKTQKVKPKKKNLNDKNIIKIIHNRDANRDVREIPLDNLLFIITILGNYLKCIIIKVV
jgi:hypothetical protein